MPASDDPGEGRDARVVASDGTTGTTDGDPLASLLRAEAQLVEQFLTAARVRDGGRASGRHRAGARVFEPVRDERTGDRYLKIRMPAPDVVDRVAQSLRALLENFKQ